MNFKKLAKTLSVILGPQLWLPVFLLAFIFKTGLTEGQINLLFPALFIFQVFIPLSCLYLGKRLGKIADIDLPKRQERLKILIIALFCLLISLVLVFYFGNKLLLHLYLIILALTVLTTVITRIWKISLHMSLNTTGSILVNFLFNWQLPILYLSIPLVFWARWKLKKHS